MAKTEKGKETGEEREKKGRRRGKLQPAGARERASRFGALGGAQAVLPPRPTQPQESAPPTNLACIKPAPQGPLPVRWGLIHFLTN